MSLDIRRYGRRALLTEPANPNDLLALAAAARELPGVEEVVPAARTALVVGASAEDAERLAALLPTLKLGREQLTGISADRGEIVLDVGYDGPDLDAVAAEIGIAADEVVQRHTAVEYVVAFCGFAPGFAYLSGLDPRLHVPRLAEPRTRVPAGAVGIAGEFTGVYPRPSPGGWRLLGRTDAQLWNVDADPPALLPPGTRVRFRAS
jgi:KipI family sensor histidine kinase inhibitor